MGVKMVEIFMDKHLFYHRQMEISQWCVEQFGDRGAYYTFDKNSDRWSYDIRWSYDVGFGNGKFRFKYPQDAMLFKLRWLGTDEN
jgi:hypothetical protein